MARHIKCPNCGIYNTNEDYCSNCNTLLSYKIRRKLAFAQAEKERKERESKYEKDSPWFFDTYINHRFWAVRTITKILHSIWLGFLAIGAFLAWLFTAIAA